MESLRLLGRAALALGLVLLVLWWTFRFGLATFTPGPFWRGVLSVAALWAAWRVWPKRVI